MIEIKNLTKSFKKNVAVNGFTFEFGDKIYGLLGPNGAGKTTLLRCIAGLYGYKEGTIIENGVDISKLKENQRNIGYLPQKFGMFQNLKVAEMLEYFCIQKNVAIDQKAIDECIALVGLEEKKNKKISTLSGGMVRRLGVAQALLGNPSLLIFDEPTAGLDPEERMRFKNIIRSLKGKCTVILSTHIVSDVSALCDNIIIMKNGSVCFSGNGEQTAALADGKIYVIEESEREKVNGEFHVIQNLNDENGRSVLRIAANKPQNFSCVQATVEDGYICCIKDI